MPLPQQAQKAAALPANTQGRDFIVGDLHGCYDQLQPLLEHVKFDKAVDRLFSVGDLVDRGPMNLECAELIYEPWFYAVRGNHEQMMIEYVLRGRQLNLVDYNTGSSWIANGGNWYYNYNHDLPMLKALAADLDMLPLVIVVGEGEARFNIVHAELKHFAPRDALANEGALYLSNFGGPRVPVTDEMIDNWEFTETDEYDMIWGREIIQNGHPTFPPPADQLWHDLNNLSITYCGHTPLRMVAFVQRQLYIDHGCVFSVRTGGHPSEENKLVIASPSEQAVYLLTPTSGAIDRLPYNELQQLS